jgi:hypothetical protein
MVSINTASRFTASTSISLDTIALRLRRNSRQASTITPQFVAALLEQVNNLQSFKALNGVIEISYPKDYGNVMAQLIFSYGGRQVMLKYNIGIEELETADYFESATPTELVKIIERNLADLMRIRL